MSTTPSSRRTFLRQSGLLAVAMAGGSFVTASCASSGSSGGGGDDKKPAGTKDNPFGVKKDAGLSVVIFDGGYGDGYAKFHEKLYAKQFPKAKISHKAITDIKQQMQTRFNGGNPPDVLDNAGAEQLPLSTLADTGQLLDLTKLFDADALGFEGKKVRDTLNPVGVTSADYDGKPLVLNYALQVYGLWYDKKLFEEKGWKPAETWADFLKLCAEIKKSGIAPIAYQGKYPYYIEQLLWDLAVKHGGHQVAYDIDSLKPNAWKSPSVKAAATAIAELRKKGYFLDGTEGLDHIQSQTRWNQGKAAFITSGSWLENEQKEVAPKGFETTLAPTPLLDGAKLPFDCGRVEAAESFVVPAKAKNTDGGLEYLRKMLSKDGAAEFTRLTSALTIVDGATEGLKLSPGAASSVALVESGGDKNWNYYYNKWYTPMEPKIGTAVEALAAGRISPEEFCSRAQKAADETAKDPSTKKRTRTE